MTDEELIALAEARYTERREQLLSLIRCGKVSASMSGIEYYPYPWAELPEKELAYQISVHRRALVAERGK